MRSKNLSWQYSLASTILLLSPFDLLASLAMDMYLPAIPVITKALGANPTITQLTLTLYLILIGTGQLIFGPLSDRFGRRPILLGGGIAYIVASFGLSMVSSAELFLGLRIIQACGASACLVATFATIRDIYSNRAESNIIYGLLSSMLAMVPALGPLLGVLVSAWVGWRAIFILLAIAMLGTVIAAWFLWPETRKQQTIGLQWIQLILPLKYLNFWLYTLCYSAGMGSFFVFFSTSPWLMMERHGLSQLSFSLLFATVSVAMMATTQLIGKITPKLGRITVIHIAMVCLAVGALLLTISELLLSNSVLAFIVPMWLIGVGIASTVSVAPNGALKGFDHIAGTITAVYFCLGGILLGAIGTVTIMLFPRATAWPIVTYCMLLAIVVVSLCYFTTDKQ